MERYWSSIGHVSPVCLVARRQKTSGQLYNHEYIIFYLFFYANNIITTTVYVGWWANNFLSNVWSFFCLVLYFFIVYALGMCIYLKPSIQTSTFSLCNVCYSGTCFRILFCMYNVCHSVTELGLWMRQPREYYQIYSIYCPIHIMKKWNNTLKFIINIRYISSEQNVWPTQIVLIDK